MQKIFYFFLALFLVLVPTASAHIGGGPPFLRVNGKYAQTNPFYSNDPTIDIPQDTNPYTQPLVVNDPIDFSIDTDKLLVPPDIASASTFRWTFSQGTHEFGKHIMHTYTKPGSYLVTIEAKAPGEIDFLVIDTVQIDIRPDKTYQLPKVSISVETTNRIATKPILFQGHISAGTALITSTVWGFGDGTNSKELHVLHSYTDVANYQNYPVVFRAIDKNGFFSDAGVILQNQNGRFHFIDANGKENTIPVKDSITTQTARDSFHTIGIIIGIFFGLIIFIGVLFFLGLPHRKMRSHRNGTS